MSNSGVDELHHKRRLDELCHRRNWAFPEYGAVKDGPDHMPSFTATVNVCGQLFTTLEACKSSEEAQNTAAGIALGHFTSNLTPLQPCIDAPHMYKNLLQQYCQKEYLGFPRYTFEVEGPQEAPRFKSKVCVEGKSYESLHFFPTLKDAEQAAAKFACQTLSVDATQEGNGLYKNLLQEFVQKRGDMCPSYKTLTSGLPHDRIYVSTVEIGCDKFQGGEAKTRKQAEINAAKLACCALTKRMPAYECFDGVFRKKQSFC